MISDTQFDPQLHHAPGSFADQLQVETPEQVSLSFPIGGLGSRFLALLIDSAIQVVSVIVLVLIASVIPNSVWSNMSGTAAKWFVAALFLFFFLLYWGYFSLFEAFWNGQTPGKRLFKIRVIKDTGRQISLFEALARNLLRPVDYLPGFYLTGVITMLCNRQQKRLGDLVAGTIVVHEPTEHQPAFTHNSRTFTADLTPSRPEPFAPTPQQVELEQNLALLPADAVARLNHDDLNIVDTFFSRSLDLDLGKRAEMATRVANRMCAKMNIPAPLAIPPERLLEAIAHVMRSHARS
jgi:uncharacterized RDD family membrane protein YckC